MNPSKAASWHYVGLTSDFPDISPDALQIKPTCKAFKVPHFPAEPTQQTDLDLPGDLKDQVLVFKYKNVVHAIDHVCPQASTSTS